MHFLPGLRQKFSEKRVPARRCHIGIGHQVPDSRFRTQDLNTNSKLDLRTNQKAAQILIIQRFDLLGQGVWERARRQLGKGDSALKPSNPGSGRSTYLYLYLVCIWFVFQFSFAFAIVFAFVFVLVFLFAFVLALSNWLSNTHLYALHSIQCAFVQGDFVSLVPTLKS